MSDQADESEATGVDARFLLASERTFLAWIRTAIALVAAGLAATQLFEPFDIPFGRRLLGVPLIVVGGLVGYLSYVRRRSLDRALEEGAPLPHTLLPRLLTVTVVAAAVVAVVLALVGPSR